VTACPTVLLCAGRFCCAAARPAAVSGVPTSCLLPPIHVRCYMPACVPRATLFADCGVSVACHPLSADDVLHCPGGRRLGALAPTCLWRYRFVAACLCCHALRTRCSSPALLRCVSLRAAAAPAGGIACYSGLRAAVDLAPLRYNRRAARQHHLPSMYAAGNALTFCAHSCTSRGLPLGQLRGILPPRPHYTTILCRNGVVAALRGAGLLADVAREDGFFLPTCVPCSFCLGNLY